MAILQVKDLQFSYPNAPECALRGLSFSVEPGSFTLLSGASGSGKTTFLKLLKREIAPFGKESGEILYDGEALRDLDPRRQASEIGFVFQDPEDQIVTDKVWHELAFGLENLGLPTSEIRKRVAEVACYFDLEHLFRRETASLSGGEKQLLNLAGVLAMRPKVLLLDEPTSELDPIAATHFLDTVARLNRETGLTVILSEHRLEEALPLADQVLLLDGGRLIFDGTPEEAVRYFGAHPENPVAGALPAAVRLFASTEDPCPLTVNEGRKVLKKRGFRAAEEVTEEEKGTEKNAAKKPEKTAQIAAELRDIRFQYPGSDALVLDRCSLRVPAGTHYVLLGGNGAGKSTVLGLLAGVLAPLSGEVRLFGTRRNVKKKKGFYAEHVGLLPQDPSLLLFGKTVREDLEDALNSIDPKQEAAGKERRILEISDLFGITPLLKRNPLDLSGGETERVALAKLLLRDPKLLLLDEPTKGFDSALRRLLAELIRKLKNEGVTVVTVTHDADFAAETADEVGLLFDGELASSEEPHHFFRENAYFTTAVSRLFRGFDDRLISVGEAKTALGSPDLN